MSCLYPNIYQHNWIARQYLNVYKISCCGQLIFIDQICIKTLRGQSNLIQSDLTPRYVSILIFSADRSLLHVWCAVRSGLGHRQYQEATYTEALSAYKAVAAIFMRIFSSALNISKDAFPQ